MKYSPDEPRKAIGDTENHKEFSTLPVNNHSPEGIYQAALAGHTAGLCIVPIREEGRKFPDLKTWKHLEQRLTTPEEIEIWFGPRKRQGIGTITGKVSGNLEVIDFDKHAIFDAYLALALANDQGAGELLARLIAGYCEQTPNGTHLLYYCAEIAGSTKLATHWKTDAEGNLLYIRDKKTGNLTTKPERKAVIETRGEGGFLVLAPSYGTVHKSGKPYLCISGSLTTIPTITPAERAYLWNLARTFQDPRLARKQPKVGPRNTQPQQPQNGTQRPGAVLAERMSWEDILALHGWVPVHSDGDATHWRRPGKDHGTSATTNYAGSDLLYVFSTSTEFEELRGYSKFAAYTILNHGGDFKKSARDIAQRFQMPRSVRHHADFRTDEANGRGPVEDTPAPTDTDALPRIQTNNRHLRDTSDDALAALEAQNDPPVLFVRDRRLARIGTNEHAQAVIENLEEAALRGHLTRAADFYRVKYNPRTEEYDETLVSPPRDIVQDILALGARPFPPLLSVITSPNIRPDGSILSQPGYDAPTRLFYAPSPGFILPPISDQPSEADARAARDYIMEELFSDFPFCDAPDIANMLGCLLTPIVRPAIAGNVPLCLLDKPTPGSGATLLADVVALVATGQPGAKVLLSEGLNSEEEMRKKITSILMDGSPLSVWDNVTESISSSALAMVLTTPIWDDRLLSKNIMVKLPVRTCFIATSNNIRLRGDLARRAYRVRIDPNQERPWTREVFRHPELLRWITEHRPQLLATVLTMARAWFVAGQPPATTPKMGSFEDWTRIVGGILSYAGMPGFLDNLQDLYELVDDDGPQWTAFFSAWFDAFGEASRTVGEFAVSAPAELKEAVPDSVEFDEDRLRSSKIRLGKGLSKRAGRIHGGFRLERSTDGHTKSVRWSIHPQVSR